MIRRVPFCSKWVHLVTFRHIWTIPDVRDVALRLSCCRRQPLPPTMQIQEVEPDREFRFAVLIGRAVTSW